MKCIKDNDKNILVHNGNIKNQQREHFDELINGVHRHVGDTIIIPVDENREFMRRIQKSRWMGL